MPFDYIAAFLTSFPDKAFCFQCLESMVSRSVIGSIEGLRPEDGFTVDERRCHNCETHGPTIGYRPPPKP